MHDETAVPSFQPNESGDLAAAADPVAAANAAEHAATVIAAADTGGTASDVSKIERKRHPALRFIRFTILPLVTLIFAVPIVSHAWREYAIADLEQTIANGGGHFVLPPLRLGSATPSLSQQFCDMWRPPVDLYDGLHVNLRNSLLTANVFQKLNRVCSASKPGKLFLVLDNGAIDYPAAATLRGLPARFDLVMTRLEMSDTAWNELRELKTVETLILDNTCLTQSGIDVIVSLPELTSLTVLIEDDSANGALAKATRKMPKIKMFEVRTRLPYRLSPEDREKLGQLPNGAEFRENVWPEKGKGIMDYL